MIFKTNNKFVGIESEHMCTKSIEILGILLSGPQTVSSEIA